ncbi:MAG: AcrR family transcriptional regulator [Pontimonas sp.]|jgi:AcrR family transcriptional regulator
MGEEIARGRPPVSSRAMLQDAAFELFLENSYAKTTVEQITQRAGVSRATFFNYFPAKSDVFWVELDHALDRLGAELRATTEHRTVLDDITALAAVLNAILAVGGELGPDRVPFALTQHELVGSIHELQASALTRFTRQAEIVTGFLSQHGLDPATAQAAAYACLAATIAGAQTWASAGTVRGTLEPYLRDAVEPVITGFNSR